MTKGSGFRTWALGIPCSIFYIPFFAPFKPEEYPISNKEL